VDSDWKRFDNCSRELRPSAVNAAAGGESVSAAEGAGRRPQAISIVVAASVDSVRKRL
jgi:hypothetical protein